MVVEVHPIRMSNPKTIYIFGVNPFQTTVFTHTPPLKYRITIGTNIILLQGFNPRKKYPQLTNGIGLICFKLINDIPT